jgi:hypothetical protein
MRQMGEASAEEREALVRELGRLESLLALNANWRALQELEVRGGQGLDAPETEAQRAKLEAALAGNRVFQKRARVLEAMASLGLSAEMPNRALRMVHLRLTEHSVATLPKSPTANAGEEATVAARDAEEKAAKETPARSKRRARSRGTRDPAPAGEDGPINRADGLQDTGPALDPFRLPHGLTSLEPDRSSPAPASEAASPNVDGRSAVADAEVRIPERKQPPAGNAASAKAIGRSPSLLSRLRRARQRPDFDGARYAAYRTDIDEATVEIVKRGEAHSGANPRHPDGADNRVNRFIKALTGT